jgi:hypothetical protein
LSSRAFTVFSPFPGRTVGNQLTDELLQSLPIASFESKKFQPRLTRGIASQNGDFHSGRICLVGELQFDTQQFPLHKTSLSVKQAACYGDIRDHALTMEGFDAEGRSKIYRKSFILASVMFDPLIDDALLPETELVSAELASERIDGEHTDQVINKTCPAGAFHVVAETLGANRLWNRIIRLS